MRLKTKLYSVIMAFCLMLSLLAVGVWAVNSGTVNIGGTVSFIATDIYATITGKVEGATSTPTLSTLNYSATSTPTQDELNTWSRDLEFAKTTTPTIKWTVTIQNKSERVLYVTLTDNMTSITNVTKSMTYDGATYTSGEKAIPANTTKIFTMTAVVNDTNKKASAVYDYAFDLRDANSDLAPDQGEEGESAVDLKWDADNEYWYVTMGSTDTIDEIKWRLVGVEGERYTSSTKPTSGTGTFILETNTGIFHVYDETNDSNEYATSDIRTYLNGDYITTLNLADDATYNAITAREISDLYTDMAWRTDDNYQVEDCTLPSGATGTDKLWLMSVAEIYTLVGGGTITDSTIDGDWSTYYDNLIWNELYYWLRSPDPDLSSDAFNVGDFGDWGGGGVVFTRAVRPAFNLELGGSSVEEDAPVNAEDVSYLTFTYNDTDMTAQLSAVASTAPVEVVIPEKIKNNENVYTVTSIYTYDDYMGNRVSPFGSSLNIEKITLPGSIKTIPELVFQNNKYLNTIILSEGVEIIEDNAVWKCTALTEISLPTSLTSIGFHAIYNCTGLTSITIPESVISIGKQAFSYCTSLAEVNVKATSVPTGGSGMFDNCSSLLVIYVPDGSYADYKSATYWSDYATKMKPASLLWTPV